MHVGLPMVTEQAEAGKALAAKLAEPAVSEAAAAYYGLDVSLASPYHVQKPWVVRGP